MEVPQDLIRAARLGVAVEPRAARSAESTDPQPKPSMPRLDEPELVEQRALERREWEVYLRYQRQRNVAHKYMRPVVDFAHEVGPDNRYYASNAEVEFDLTPVQDDPEKTLEKAETIRRAALANRTATGEELMLAARAALLAALARSRLVHDSGDEAETTDAAAGSGAAVDTYQDVAAPAAASPLSPQVRDRA